MTLIRPWRSLGSGILGLTGHLVSDFRITRGQDRFMGEGKGKGRGRPLLLSIVHHPILSLLRDKTIWIVLLPLASVRSSDDGDLTGY